MSDPFAQSLAIKSEIVRERDTRWLEGGNFFGTEAAALPPLEPLPIDAIKEAEAAARAAELAARPAASAAPMLLKLPNTSKRGGKSPV